MQKFHDGLPDMSEISENEIESAKIQHDDNFK